jgi:hypothetical protein
MGLLPAEVRLQVLMDGELRASAPNVAIVLPRGSDLTVAGLMGRLEFDPVRTRPAGEEQQERIGRRTLVIAEELIAEELNRGLPPPAHDPAGATERDRRMALARRISERIEATGR